ncbi:pilus assembly protein [Marilutibacter maris]|uniref:pilus assembly protein n=1 Tax=Marilutibacter maris TaxID=1605891 RepID=UPI001CB913E7|nr:PilC/PilY family type IV pilus protein [Lysobacter maris]
METDVKEPCLKSAAPRLFKIATVAFVATLMGLPVQAALTVPPVPPRAGNGVPPNILFILDDSGSMALPTMSSATVPTVSLGISDFTYVSNTVHYNPAITYRPWMKADGTRRTGGTTYNAVYASLNHAGGASINLRDPKSCSVEEFNGQPITFCGGIQYFHVPKNKGNTATAYLSNGANYWRYYILDNSFAGDAGRVLRCGYASGTGLWNNGCTWATPTGRTDAQERQNYARWFSYHRTRIKSAKAGSSEAFQSLDGDKYRVGFTTIWGPNGDGAGNPEFLIPVNADNGLFRGNNRATWFNRLHGTRAYNGTPLLPALDRAGGYYSSTSDDGPGGGLKNGNGRQFACRQNFAILTTDGYWNSGSSNKGDADSIAGDTITGPNSAKYTYRPSRPYRDNRGPTLADVAMHYWKNDLRPDLDNIVPQSPGNPAFWQHMVTFGISIGLRGTLDPKTAVNASGASNDLTDGGLSWPNPLDEEDSHRIDDLFHAAVNSRGKFVAASDPAAFAKGLQDALAAIANNTSSSSSVAASSTSLQAGSTLFQATFVGGQWTGELRGLAVTASGIDGSNPKWEASQQLPAFASRKIFTSDLATTGAAFPTLSQIGALNTVAAPAASNGAAVANYLKGDTSQEIRNGGSFRDRVGLLGDIIHSSPAYLRDNDTVFVGSNDGMLHAFDASSGVERFAYIPGGIAMTDLKTLVAPDYAHKYFVDGPVVVSTKAQTPNRNVLVGTMGRGGSGVFALDVTNPRSFGASDVEWDLASVPDMGQVIGDPFIARLNNGKTGVIIGNGVNSPDDKAYLIVIDIADGTVLATIPADGSVNNGLSSPRGVDEDLDGDVDHVYAGDLLGNLWKFDLSNSNESRWESANKVGSTPVPLFVARDADGNRQPISGGVTTAVEPGTFRRWVFFGTGRYITSADPQDKSVQTMYGLIDEAAAIASRADLVKRTTAAAGVVGGRRVRTFEPSSTAMPPDKEGWYVDFAPPAPGTAEGERMIGNPDVVAQVLQFSSIVPSDDPCAPGGRGFVNVLNPFTGASVTDYFFDADGDGVFSDDELNGNAIGSLELDVGMVGDGVLFDKLLGAGGTKGNTDDVNVNNPVAPGRISWREILRN